eukprot:5793428-Prymnesium_polylepis.1
MRVMLLLRSRPALLTTRRGRTARRASAGDHTFGRDLHPPLSLMASLSGCAVSRFVGATFPRSICALRVEPRPDVIPTSARRWPNAPDAGQTCQTSRRPDACQTLPDAARRPRCPYHVRTMS